MTNIPSWIPPAPCSQTRLPLIDKPGVWLSIPVAFHCHNNLGLSAANALAAWQNGAAILDCGLMGMARSAGNLATEVCVALMQRHGEMKDIDLFGMLDFIENRLQPAMAAHNYHNPISPTDLTLGYS